MKGEGIERLMMGIISKEYDVEVASNVYYNFQNKYYKKHRDENIKSFQKRTFPDYVDKRADTFVKYVGVHYPKTRQYIKNLFPK